MTHEEEIKALKFRVDCLGRDLALERAAKYAAESRAIEQHGKRMEADLEFQEVLRRVRKQLALTHGLEVVGGGAPDDSGRIDNSMQIAEIDAVVSGEPQESKWKLVLADKIAEKDAHIHRLRMTLALIAADGSRYPHLLAKETLKITPDQSLAEHYATKDKRITSETRRAEGLFNNNCTLRLQIREKDAHINGLLEALQRIQPLIDPNMHLGAALEARETIGQIIQKALAGSSVQSLAEHDAEIIAAKDVEIADIKKEVGETMKSLCALGAEKGAHINRLRDALQASVCQIKTLKDKLGEFGAFLCYSEAEIQIQTVLDSTPAQSLAEHDAEMINRHFFGGYMRNEEYQRVLVRHDAEIRRKVLMEVSEFLNINMKSDDEWNLSAIQKALIKFRAECLERDTKIAP